MKDPIVYVARFVPGYRRPVLEELNDRLNGRLVVCAGTPAEASFKALSSGSAPTYKRIRLRNTWIGGQRALIQNTKPVFACNPCVLLAEESPRTLSLPHLLTTAQRKGIGTLLWGHFSSNRRALTKRHPLDRYRIALAKRVDGCVCYTDQIAELIAPYVPGRRCFVARNTLDTPRLFKLYSTLEAEGKARVRNRLGLPEQGRIVVFVGRLVADKRPEILLDLHKALGATQQTALVLIGDGPEFAKLLGRVENEGLKNVFLPGAIPRLEDSAPWIYAADVMVCPGYVGLNVNHAFCLGLPVVTCTSPDPKIRYHSPEIAYLQPNVNGMQARYGDPNELVKAVLAVLDNRDYFSANALAYAQANLKLESMIDGLVEAIHYAEERTLAKG
ncbi:MAG: glycosyltransferase family 4 protein [Rhodothermaceae bacterium]|nr:glycosyltransferase family 4 protein [Rhodothermaceae bacterium]MYI84234.1 glycosyltransferase family 4 protein [Rhodothermaceae bacterium]